jgi:putative membrane protein
MKLLVRWVAAAVAVWAAAHLVDGITVQGGVVPHLAVALLLGLVNAFVRPLLRWLACGLVFLTLGLFLLVINAGMLLLTSWLAGVLDIGFEVEGFVPALLGSVVISLVSFAASVVLGGNERRPRRR